MGWVNARIKIEYRQIFRAASIDERCHPNVNGHMADCGDHDGLGLKRFEGSDDKHSNRIRKGGVRFASPYSR